MTPPDALRELRARGATRLRAVCFRSNRSTIWSLTGRGTRLNLHDAFRSAPDRVLDAFATIVREGGRQTAGVRRACHVVETWPPLQRAIQRLRSEHEARARTNGHAAGQGPGAVSCCATPQQREYLRAIYRYFNQTRFEGRLPDDIPVRLSSRMSTSLGHMLPGEDRNGHRSVVEIALSADLMLPGNGAERVDTLIHEMAHVADYVFDGNRGHGSSWRRWAREAGCRAQTLYDRPVRRRRDRRERVTRVPPLPPALSGRDD